MNLVECSCGTIYHVNEGKSRHFRCVKCSKTVVLESQQQALEKVSSMMRISDSPQKLAKWFLFVGSFIGIFTLLLMIPTAFVLKDQTIALAICLVLELVFGTLLVCSSLSFYLLSLQVQNMQSMTTFHQHNLQIFADQISKLFQMIRRSD